MEDSDLSRKDSNITKSYPKTLASKYPEYASYRNKELENFCQKVKILHENWKRVTCGNQNNLLSSPIVTIHDLSEYYQGEPVKIIVHIKEQISCNFFKNLKTYASDVQNYQESLKQKDKVIKAELQCLNTIKPSEIIKQSLEKMMERTESIPIIEEILELDQNQNLLVLRFKDYDEYLLNDLPLLNYSNYHKLSIDDQAVYLELLRTESSPRSLDTISKFDEEIYKISVKYINQESSLIKNHPNLKKKLNHLISCYHVLEMFSELTGNSNLKGSAKIDDNLSKLYETMGIHNLDEAAEQQFKKLISMVFSSNITEDRQVEYIKMFIGMICETSQSYCQAMRNFMTKKLSVLIKIFTNVKGKSDIPNVNVLNQFIFEIFKITEIYYSSMSFSIDDIFLTVPPKLIDAYKNQPNTDFHKITTKNKLQIVIKSICNIVDPSIAKYDSFYISGELIYFSKTVCPKAQTTKFQTSNISGYTMVAETNIYFDIKVSELKSEMGVLFYFVGCYGTQENKLYVGYSQLYGENVKFLTSDSLIGLIPINNEATLRVVCRSIELNKSPERNPYIHAFIASKPNSDASSSDDSLPRRSSSDKKAAVLTSEYMSSYLNRFHTIIITRSYRELEIQDAKTIWHCRESFKNFKYEYSFIPLIVASGVLSYAPDHEFEDFFEDLETLSVEDYLLMLGPIFSNIVVRKYMITKMSYVSPEIFCNYANIMVNCLSFEPNLWSTYMCLLIQRCWDDPQIAHLVFWACKRLSEDPFSSNNFIAIMAVIMTTSYEYHQNLTSQIIFKVGDILARDMVTIQIFRILFKIWLKSGMDLRMRIYDVLATSQEEGFIEVVPDVKTMGEIQGFGGLTGTFNQACIVDWLKSVNSSKKEYEKAIMNFILSCAGYCVATYILGICDRHNDNILLLKSGHIFHIDFNKYMGDAQTFLGFKRDRAPFVLTPDMLAVINEYKTPECTGFQFFVEKCCLAYKLARKNASTIFNPSFDNCIKYITEKLKLDLSDSDAYVAFYKLIEISSNTTFTQINFFIHNLAQKRISKSSNLANESVGLFEFCNSIDIFDIETDGKIVDIAAVDHVNKRVSNRINTTYFIIRILREDKTRQIIFRNAEDIQNLLLKLKELEKYNEIKADIYNKLKYDNQNYLKKKYLYEVLYEINRVLRAVLTSTVSKSEVLYTWCHPYSDDTLMSNEAAAESNCEGQESQIPRVKMTFDLQNDVLFVLILNFQNLRLLSVNTDSEISFEVKLYLYQIKTMPSGFSVATKKRPFNTVTFVMEKLEIPYGSVIKFEKSMKMFVRVHRMFGSKIHGQVEIPFTDLDYTRVNGVWFNLESCT